MDIHRFAQAFTYSEFNKNLTWRARIRIIVFSLPVLLTLAAVGFAVESGLYVLRSEATVGTVVQRYEWPGETLFDRGQTNYEPVFEFALDGEAARRASVGSAHASFDVAVGETAMIRALPGDNGNVRMATWQGLWFIPAMLGLFAAVAWPVSGALWWVVRRFFAGPVQT